MASVVDPIGEPQHQFTSFAVLAPVIALTILVGGFALISLGWLGLAPLVLFIYLARYQIRYGHVATASLLGPHSDHLQINPEFGTALDQEDRKMVRGLQAAILVHARGRALFVALFSAIAIGSAYLTGIAIILEFAQVISSVIAGSSLVRYWSMWSGLANLRSVPNLRAQAAPHAITKASTPQSGNKAYRKPRKP